jgi:hypothetical protein
MQQSPTTFLQQIRCSHQRVRACLGRGAAPADETCLRGRHGPVGCFSGGFHHFAHPSGAVDGTDDPTNFARCGSSVDQRLCLEGLSSTPFDFIEQSF